METNIIPRGRTITGTVVSAKMHNTVTVEWERRNYLKKYQRYEKRRSKVKAHNPEAIHAKEGDIVKIQECRPLSKTKHFIVIEVLGQERGFKERMAAKAESKVQKPVKEEAQGDEAPEAIAENESN